MTRKAVDEEVQSNSGDNQRNITVSGDGTWRKRGFSSLFGVATLIGKATGKVVDAVVKSSYCQMCTLWKNKFDTEEEYNDWMEDHKKECGNNHDGNAGKMEPDTITEIFKRSEDKYEVKYTTYIGDGDSKTFKEILEENPYKEIPVTKRNVLIISQKEWVRDYELWSKQLKILAAKE